MGRAPVEGQVGMAGLWGVVSPAAPLCGGRAISHSTDEEGEASPKVPQPGWAGPAMGSLGQEYSHSCQGAQPGPRPGADEALLEPWPCQLLHPHCPHCSSRSWILPQGLCSTVPSVATLFLHGLWALLKGHLLREAPQSQDPSLRCRGSGK